MVSGTVQLASGSFWLRWLCFRAQRETSQRRLRSTYERPFFFNTCFSISLFPTCSCNCFFSTVQFSISLSSRRFHGIRYSSPSTCITHCVRRWSSLTLSPEFAATVGSAVAAVSFDSPHVVDSVSHSRVPSVHPSGQSVSLVVR